MENDAALRELVEGFQVQVAGGDSVEGAARRLKGYGAPAALVEAARDAYERQVGRIRELKDPGALVDKELTKGYWYGGPKESDLFWPALEARLRPAIDDEGLLGVGQSSDRVLGLMRPPGAPEISTRGLVLGYVQSGKTTNFMSVIAKAADQGYRLFIVLSGITDNLRSQTQERLEDVLVGELREKWFLLTDRDTDFHRSDNAPNLLSQTDHRLLAVVKKNPYRLKRVKDWLDSAGEAALKSCPVLLIDDEADQASIDVGKARRSRINGLIRQLLDKPKVAYVAYTATPFANLLIDPDPVVKDLYPRDFIVDLPRSSSYFGPERIFGREPLVPEEEGTSIIEGLDVVRHLAADEIPAVQPPRGKGAVYGWTPKITPSLREAVLWFVVATAARRARGTGNRHSTMLVHTSMLSEAHVRLASVVSELIEQELTPALGRGDRTLLNELEALWSAESALVIPETGSQDSWEQVRPHLAGVLTDTRVVIDNYRSTERLAYSDDEKVPPTTAIVVGGNTLSRGLTLEGLVCSFFVRSASAYDTLLQMGRWFGYRKGYEDLTRIWMPGDLEAWFFDLATVEEEIRREIKRYEDEDLRPSDLAVKIRTHPAMAITSAAKMRHAVAAEVSYGRTRQQTILFEYKDKEWLEDNQGAVRRLTARVRALGIDPIPRRDSRIMLPNVPVEEILRFFGEYKFHERAQQMRPDLLKGYVEEQGSQGFLRSWNVVFMSHPNDENGTLDLGLDGEVNLIQRSRMDIPGLPHANIKSLVSVADRVADLDQSTSEVRGLLQSAGSKVNDAALLKLREELLGDVGLIGIYPINKDSQPLPKAKKDGKRARLPLEAVDHVIGVGIFFPEAKGARGAYSYMAADLSSEEVEDLEDDLAALDRADEERGEAEDAASDTRRRA